MITMIYLIRHGECKGNIENRLSGITDFEITQRGKEQTYLLASKMKEFKISKIYSSPLSRAVDTARIIMKENQINKLNIDNELQEINYEVCDGMSWDDIDNEYPMVRKEWKKIYHYPVNIPGQESFNELQKRIKNAIIKITNDNLGENIAIISHGIAISSFLCLVKNLNAKECYKLKIQKNTSYSILKFSNGKFYLLEESNSDHLKEDIYEQ